ncbi:MULTISPECIES: sodium-independent anion transporter [unclassified Sinorhizobium]|uniref:sodium-independent anion transporter n=1 Tax=unclassified Sinorhizobium TaxID=2613772 RepID=UPI0030145FD1
MLILRPDGRLFFANIQQVADQIQSLVPEHKPHVLALDMSGVFDIEYSAIQMMIESERRLTAQGITVWLAGLNPDVLDYGRAPVSPTNPAASGSSSAYMPLSNPIWKALATARDGTRPAASWRRALLIGSRRPCVRPTDKQELRCSA